MNIAAKETIDRSGKPRRHSLFQIEGDLVQIVGSRIARSQIPIAIDAEPTAWQRSGLADVIQHSRIGERRVGRFSQTISQFREDPTDSSPGVARVEFVAEAVGQLAGDAEIIIELGQQRHRSVGVEGVSLASIAAAADVETEARPIAAPALGRDIDHAAEGVASEDGSRAGQDLDPFDVFDRYEIEVDRVEIRLVHAHAVDKDTSRRHRLGVEAAQVDGLLKLVADAVVEHHAGLILQNFLNRFPTQFFDLFRSDNDHFARYLCGQLGDIGQATRIDEDRGKSGLGWLRGLQLRKRKHIED